MKVIINGRYETKDGKEVKIYAIYPNINEPIEQVHGAMFEHGEWSSDTWSLDGFYYQDKCENEDNLVELDNTDPKFWKRNKPIMVNLGVGDKKWFRGHFWKVDERGNAILYANGNTSFTRECTSEGKIRQMFLPDQWREPTAEELK